MLTLFAFGMALVGIVSLVSLYVYEHPQHHCPFCLLKAGHGFAGYWLYIPLFAATALALSAATIGRWRHLPSLADTILSERTRLSWMAIVLFAVFYLIATVLVATSNLTMEGVWW